MYRISCECGLVNIADTNRNLSLRLKEHKTNCERAELEKSAGLITIAYCLEIFVKCQIEES